MKFKAIVTVAAIILLAACETPYRATDTGIIISVNAQKSFEDQYPSGTNVEWTNYDPNVVILNDWELSGWEVIDQSDYAVSFDMDGQRYYAWYDKEGNWIGTAYVVKDYTTLPTYVRTTVTAQYPSYTIASVNREYYKDRTSYEVVLVNSEGKLILLMDESGNILKSKYKMK